ncbi:MAG: efflux RND transporter periplasmic adaptor subunit [bacterium]
MSQSDKNDSNHVTESAPEDTPSSDASDGLSEKLRWGLTLIGILLAGGGLAWLLATTGPKAERKEKPDEQRASRVEIIRVNRTTNTVQLQGYGSVEAARKIQLVPQVSGTITDRSDSFRPGGFFDRGDSIVQIEQSDYRLAVEQRRSELQQAQADLTIAQSNQSAARDEYERIKDQITVENPDVILKEPQVKSARAAVQKARSALEQAKLNLERTTLEAPFDAHVTQRNVELGMNVSTGQTLATIVGTNEYWIKVSLSPSKLKWLMDETGRLKKNLPVRVYNKTTWPDSSYREAAVTDLIRELETKGRMAQVLVSVSDPLALDPQHSGKPAVMVGSYVRSVIDAGTLPESVRLDRDLLKDGDKVWVATPEGTLDIREVTVAFRDKEDVLITEGLESGDRVIHTDLSSPVDGMAVTVKNGPGRDLSGKNTTNESAEQKRTSIRGHDQSSTTPPGTSS